MAISLCKAYLRLALTHRTNVFMQMLQAKAACMQMEMACQMRQCSTPGSKQRSAAQRIDTMSRMYENDALIDVIIGHSISYLSQILLKAQAVIQSTGDS